MKALNGWRPTHKNKWLFIKHDILSLQELALLECYADIFDFDNKHTGYSYFEVYFEEIALIFRKSENTIRNWHNKLLSLGFIEKTTRIHKYKIKTPERYITSGKWKGEADYYAKLEKDQSIEIILSNFGIEYGRDGEKIQPVVKNKASTASKVPSIALGSSKDQSRDKQVTRGLDVKERKSPQEYEEKAKESQLEGLSADDMQWIDESLSGESSKEEAKIFTRKPLETAGGILKNESDLVKDEIRLWELLNTLSKNSEEYEATYHKWFAIRERGFSKDLYHFFIPSKVEPWMQKIKREVSAWN